MKNTLEIAARGEREIMMTRSFDAPRELVWDCLTRPELVKRWLGVFGGWEMPVCEIDLRVGGSYRYQWRAPDGSVMGLRGIYREIRHPERLVTTEQFDESWYPGGAVGTAVLTEKAGKTTVTTTILYDSREAREAVLQSPMQKGVAAGYEQLDAVLSTLTQA